MNVFQYIRISDKDQSNCSIEGQQRFNEMFAQKNGMNIIETFIDDGVSAKDFNRPEWKRLEAKLKYRNVQGIIVWKYDRLIRNVMEGLAFLDKAEKQYGVTIYSAMETFSINPYDPMFFKIRADILVNAEYERRIITDRTNFGIWSAKMQGKYIGQAPFGYINARDEKNKPIIIPDESKRHIVEYIFQAFSIGQSPKRIQDVANKMGMNRKGHDTIRNIVTNPVYKGYILAPDYKNQGEKLVKAIHESLIDIDTWEKCQTNLNSDKPKSIANPELPLRGFVRCCSCGNVLTGGRSKGRSAFYYYYRCFTCSNVNINTNNVEKRVYSILNDISISEKVLSKTESILLSKFSKMETDALNDRMKVQKKIEELKQKRESLESKYIADKIDHETYKKWSIQFTRELSILNADLEYLSTIKQVTKEKISDNIKKLCKLGFMYEIAGVNEKQELCRYVFQELLYISNTTYRTVFLNEIFFNSGLNIKDLEFFDKSQLHGLYGSIPESTPFRMSIEPKSMESRFAELILIISKIA